MAPNKSEVWKYFSKVDKPDLVKCLICKKNLKFSNNTTNMLQHLRLKHVKEADQLQQPKKNNGNNDDTRKVIIEDNTNGDKPGCSNHQSGSSAQPSILNVFKNVQSFSRGGLKNEKLTDDIVQMIAEDNLPFDFVEGAGFLSFMKKHFPLYNVPTRNTIKARIDAIYEVQKEKFKTVLSNTTCLSLTTDIWTSRDMKSMLGVTVHGVHNKKQLYGTIRVFELTEAHTSLHISKVLTSALEDFGIDADRVLGVITDNGANIVKAVGDTFGKRRHIPCFAHTLNLVCENSLNIPEIQIIISKCRNIVKWFKRSIKGNDDLRRVQESAGISEGKMLKLILDVKTRWNSTYYMLERFIKLISYVSPILFNYSDSPPMISTKDKDEIVEILSILRPIEAMTRQISSEKHASLSQVIPLIHCGRTALTKAIALQPTAQKLQTTILGQFERRFGQIENCILPAASTLLDPRFKNYNFSNPVALASIIKFLRSEISSFEHSIESGSESSECSLEVEFDLWAPHKTLVHKRRKKMDDCTQPQDELNFFLSNGVVELSRNVIDTWDEMKTVYPKLYTLAHKYCFLIGTSVPAERLFSKAGATATEKRNRLTTKRLSKLLFLQSFKNIII